MQVDTPGSPGQPLDMSPICPRRVLKSPQSRSELLSEEDVVDQPGSSEPPTPLSCDSRLGFSKTSLTLYCLVSSVSKSLFSRMSGFGWKGERE